MLSLTKGYYSLVKFKSTIEGKNTHVAQKK